MLATGFPDIYNAAESSTGAVQLGREVAEPVLEKLLTNKITKLLF